MFPTVLVKYLIRITFFMFSFLFPVNQNKITFASYRSEELEGNLLYLYKEFEKQDCNFRYKFLFKRYRSSLFGKFHYVLHMVQACYALATSRFFIIDDFYFPVYAIKPRKGTDIVQLWHGAGAFKKFGLSTINKPFGPSKEYLKFIKIHSNYSRVYVSSKNVIPHYSEAFDMEEEKILPLGIPRTDFFFNGDLKSSIMKKFKELYPEFHNKKLILYAPTFRGSSHYQEDFENPINIPLLKEIVGNDYALIIHLHPYMKSGIIIEEKDRCFARQITDGFTVEELLAITDVLITDYSSIIFDFSLLNRPIAFFANDLEDYIKERDFYYDFKTIIPGPLFTETIDLANWIKTESCNFDKIMKFKEYFFDYHDGKASERIVKHLLSIR
nr:CDP-glycerol glycerophosphotransferase family protein [Cytobacillus firmus]